VTDGDVHIDDGVSADFGVSRGNGKRPDVTAGTDLGVARQNSSWMYKRRGFPSEFLSDTSHFCARLVFANGAEKPQLTAFEYMVYIFNGPVHGIALMLSSAFCGVGVRVAEHAPKNQTAIGDRIRINVIHRRCDDGAETASADYDKFTFASSAASALLTYDSSVLFQQLYSLSP
jgi:hypothetical protein